MFLGCRLLCTYRKVFTKWRVQIAMELPIVGLSPYQTITAIHAALELRLVTKALINERGISLSRLEAFIIAAPTFCCYAVPTMERSHLSVCEFYHVVVNDDVNQRGVVDQKTFTLRRVHDELTGAYTQTLRGKDGVHQLRFLWTGREILGALPAVKFGALNPSGGEQAAEIAFSCSFYLAFAFITFARAVRRSLSGIIGVNARTTTLFRRRYRWRWTWSCRNREIARGRGCD